MPNYLQDKVIVITGGSSGIGLETARQLLERGARVAITGRDAKRLAAAQSALGGQALAVQADACSQADWQRLLDRVEAELGPLDILVNNHGAALKIAPVEEMEDADIQAVLHTNLASVISGCREAVRRMRPRGCGAIVNVSSACAHHSWANWAVYTAAKAGMVGFTRCLHKEMAEWGGKATSFVPGAARTGFCEAAKIDDSWQEGFPEAAEFAHSLVHCLDVPPSCVIEELNVWGTRQVREMLNPY
ncbi:MAG: hypothetical protein RL095_3776 [Verrucomicrobiota bacterium]|jgi:NAD(P)-dependent dehydrogenase (short-subunit alcohol dehydrogenase family)